MGLASGAVDHARGRTGPRPVSLSGPVVCPKWARPAGLIYRFRGGGLTAHAPPTGHRAGHAASTTGPPGEVRPGLRYSRYTGGWSLAPRAVQAGHATRSPRVATGPGRSAGEPRMVPARGPTALATCPPRTRAAPPRPRKCSRQRTRLFQPSAVTGLTCCFTSTTTNFQKSAISPVDGINSLRLQLGHRRDEVLTGTGPPGSRGQPHPLIDNRIG